MSLTFLAKKGHGVVFYFPKQAFDQFSDYLTTSVKVLFSPCQFFNQALTGGAINPLAHQLPARDKLTKFLTIAVLIATLAVPMHQWMLKQSGASDAVLNMATMNHQKIIDNYAKITGQPLTLVDFNKLTGINLIDSPIADGLKLLTYLLFGTTFWLLSKGKLPAKSVMVYFIYAFGACLGLEALLVLSHDLMILSQHQTGQPYDWMTAAQTGSLTSVPRLIFLFIMPAIIFPKLYEVTTSQVVKITFMAVIMWGLIGITASQAMLSNGLIVIFPGF